MRVTFASASRRVIACAALGCTSVLVGCGGDPGESSGSADVSPPAGRGGAEAPAAVMKLPAGASHVGEPITVAEPVSLADVRKVPGTYLERTVLVEASAADVCQAAGCWMTLAEGAGDPILVVWSTGCGGQYAFPKDSAGKRVLVQGTLAEKEISKEDAAHMAGESKGLDAESITGKTFEINATAFVVLPDEGGAGAS